MRIRVAIALAMIAWISIQGCSKESSPQPQHDGALDLVVHYQGAQGAVDMQHPVLAYLYEGINTRADGPPDFSLRATGNPMLLHFTHLPAGTYTLSAFYDVGGDTLHQVAPYVVYDGKEFGQTPDPVTIEAGGTTQLSLAFGDAFLRQPNLTLPEFSLPDSNPGSASYATELTPADLAGARAILYFAEARNAPVPDFSLVDINPTSPTQGQLVAFSSMRDKRVMVFFGEAS